MCPKGYAPCCSCSGPLMAHSVSALGRRDHDRNWGYCGPRPGKWKLGWSARDPGRVKTPKERTRRVILFYRRRNFQVGFANAVEDMAPKKDGVLVQRS